MDTELTIDIFRHAQAENNTKPELISGKSAKSGLTTLGVWQANRLGQRLSSEKIVYKQVYMSPFTRVRDTAMLALVDVYPIEQIIEVADLEETDMGAYVSQPRKLIYTDAVLNQINAQGKFFTPPNGESLRMVERRISNWFEDEILHNPRFNQADSRIGIFTSGTALKCFLHYVLGFNDRMIFKTTMDNTALNRLRFNKDGWWVDKINDTGHLFREVKVNDRE